MIRLYILGLLQRYGPQHGYSIKKRITEQLADFTQIKLPTIYYHLEKMEKEGLLRANSEKAGNRPEKTVYSITENGVAAFRSLFDEALEFKYRPVFHSDGVFFFSEYSNTEELAEHLERYANGLQTALSALQLHQRESMQFVPEEMKKMAAVIFSHHEHHYRAELEWAEETIEDLRGK